jgi:oligopeptide transport system ATP-binding protein
MNLYPSQLSGGQQQRVGIARALAMNPNVIIADEPISALDVSIQSGVVNMIKSISRSRGISFIFIAHDLRMVKYISDRIAVIYRGKIVEQGKADDVYDNPVHPYTKKLISAVPSINKINQSLKLEDNSVNFKEQKYESMY